MYCSMLVDKEEIPDEIMCGEQVFDISFHPSMPFMAAGLINGRANLYQYSTTPGVPSSLVLSCDNHTSSCRGVEFDPSGNALYTVSSDGNIVCLDGEGRVLWKREEAHDDSINKLTCMQENCFATGDDSGVVKIWYMKSV